MPSPRPRQAKRTSRARGGDETSSLDKLLARVLDDAIAVLRKRRINLYTVAYYWDRESRAVSVCADTRANSERNVVRQNRYWMRDFADAISQGDLDAARLCQSNVGRNLSLGDFVLVNVARTPLGPLSSDTKLPLALIRALILRERDLVALAGKPADLVFVATDVGSEVGFTWSARPASETRRHALKKSSRPIVSRAR